MQHLDSCAEKHFGSQWVRECKQTVTVTGNKCHRGRKSKGDTMKVIRKPFTDYNQNLLGEICGSILRGKRICFSFSDGELSEEEFPFYF